MNENEDYPTIEFNLNSDPPRIHWHYSLKDELAGKIPFGWTIDSGTIHTFDDHIWIANLVQGIDPEHNDYLKQIAMDNFIYEMFDKGEWFTVLERSSNNTYLLNSEMMGRLGLHCLKDPGTLPAWVKLEADSAEVHEVAYGISEISTGSVDFELIKIRAEALGDYLTVSVINHSPNAVKADVIEYEGPSDIHRSIIDQVERGLSRYIIDQNVIPPWGQSKYEPRICQACGTVGEWRSLFIADSWMGFDNKNKKKSTAPVVIEIVKCNGAGRFCKSCFDVLEPAIFCLPGTVITHDR